MAIPLTGTGGLFTRLGKLAGELNVVNANIGTILGTAVNGIEAQFQSADQNLMDGLYTSRDSFRSTASGWQRYLSVLAKGILVQMANDDTPLASLDVPTAFSLLYSQMILNVQSVQQVTTTSTITALRPDGTANVGNGILVVSLLNPDGTTAQLVIAENLTATITSDGQMGATVGQERLTIRGTVSEPNKLQWDWPLGSGSSNTLNAVDATTSQGTNLLNNSDFETFVTTPNVPDQWVIILGTAGSTIQAGGAGQAYTGVNCLQLIGNGAEHTSLAQTFGVSTGTLPTLSYSTQYALNAFIKVSAVPAAGVLEFALVDGSNNITTDAAGNGNTISKNLTTATTGYLPVNGFFRTPAVLPATLKLRIRLSTALDNTKSVFIDHLALTPMTQLYPGGEWASFFSASIPMILNDTYTIAITNNATSTNWNRAFESLIGLSGLQPTGQPWTGRQLPVSNGPTIASALITSP